MTDEKFVFVSDVKDKKRTARGSFNKVRGTGRKVKFPSDYMSEKERKAMNGAVKSYDLTNPMKYAEFCAMPEDLRREYILRLQRLYRAGDVAIGEMMGVSKTAILRQRTILGIGSLAKGGKPYPEWNNFVKHGSPREATPLKELVSPEVKAKLTEYEEKHPAASTEKTDSPNPMCAKFTPKPKEEVFRPFAVPMSGDIKLKGTAAMIGETLYLLTGGEKITCRISWEVGE